MEYRLPDVGEGITESVLVKWHVRPGQSINEDDAFCTIETDKAMVELPAPCNGTVTSIDIAEGATVAVGTVIAKVEPQAAYLHATSSKDADKSGATPLSGRQVSELRQADPSPDGQRRLPVTPSTRRYARALGVNLSMVSGSGPKGRILRDDVDSAVTFANSRTSGVAGAENSKIEPSSERIPISRLRRVIADNMRRSVDIIPHATSSFRCDAAAFVDLRNRCQKKFGQRISYTALLMKAMLPALKAYPNFNASIDDKTQEIVLHRVFNIAFATQTDEGLIVPVMKDVARKSLLEVSNEIAVLAGLARERRIQLADLRGATITLSNVGSHGGHDTGGRPIVNHPQVAIIATGRIRAEPAVHDNVVCVRPIMNLTTSYDHRLIDGAYAAGFMETFIEIIEAPSMVMALS